MTRQTLEMYQVLFYIAAILLGLSFGYKLPGLESVVEMILWPALGVLLYTTFTQISFAKLNAAFGDFRFLAAALTGNFVFIPFVVWGMIMLLPDDPAIRLGVALVLLVPCTDWFIAFTQLGGGDAERAIVFTPVSLLFQILLLPAYLILFFGSEMTVLLATGDMLFAFGGIILLPLIAAYLTEKWAGISPQRRTVITGLGWLPVPLLSFVIFLIAYSQSYVLYEATSILWYPVAAFILFLIVAVLLSKAGAKFLNLPAEQGRVLAFSFGSRNSFVVLPLALALPEPFGIVVFIVVLQSLVELFGMAVYVWFVPNILFR